jgi:hypothetical protein
MCGYLGEKECDKDTAYFLRTGRLAPLNKREIIIPRTENLEEDERQYILYEGKYLAQQVLW